MAVAVFGSRSVAIAFLVYDLLELGSLGTRLFLAVRDGVAFMLLTAYPRTFGGAGVPAVPGFGAAAAGTDALRLVLLLGGVALVAGFALEAVARTGPRQGAAPPAETPP